MVAGEQVGAFIERGVDVLVSRAQEFSHTVGVVAGEVEPGDFVWQVKLRVVAALLFKECVVGFFFLLGACIPGGLGSRAAQHDAQPRGGDELACVAGSSGGGGHVRACSKQREERVHSKHAVVPFVSETVRGV